MATEGLGSSKARLFVERPPMPPAQCSGGLSERQFTCGKRERSVQIAVMASRDVLPAAWSASAAITVHVV